MKTDPESAKYYSTKDLAKLLGIGDATVKRWADLGEIPCSKTVGGHRRFTLETVKQVAARLNTRIPGVFLKLDRAPGRR
jgi:excisionase family DNA binding protein